MKTKGKSPRRIRRITTDSVLWEVIAQATHESVNNLATATADGEVEIPTETLKTILILLKFHPIKSIRQNYIDIVQSLLSPKSRLASDLKLAKGDAKAVKGPKSPDDPLAQVMDIIADYGRRCMEREQRKKTAKDNNI